MVQMFFRNFLIFVRIFSVKVKEFETEKRTFHELWPAKSCKEMWKTRRDSEALNPDKFPELLLLNFPAETFKFQKFFVDIYLTSLMLVYLY